jgi:hypothetical protein
MTITRKKNSTGALKRACHKHKKSQKRPPKRVQQQQQPHPSNTTTTNNNNIQHSPECNTNSWCMDFSSWSRKYLRSIHTSHGLAESLRSGIQQWFSQYPLRHDTGHSQSNIGRHSPCMDLFPNTGVKKNTAMFTYGTGSC